MIKVIGTMFRALAVVIGFLSLAGCSPREPDVPPDLFYLFATYTVGKNPTSVQTADFNQDGFTDLITTNISDDSLSLLFGNGDGTFRDHVRLSVSKQPRSLALNDYNGDGLTDLAVACSGSDQIALFFGNANGSFGRGQKYNVYRSPISVTSGDLNGDHKPDLVAALRNDKIAVFLGNGDGSFTRGPQYEYGDTPTSVALADLNRDGNLDLAVSNGGPMSSAVSIWIGNGDGSFREPTDYRTGKRPLSVTFADFNNDGIFDLLVINGQKDSFTTFLGNGDGTFQAGTDSGADAGPVHGLAGDFNGDRLADVAIVNIQSHNLSIVYGRGDGTFGYPPKNYRVKRGPFYIAPLHLRTGATEEPGLVTANNAASSISVFLHRGLKSRT